MVEQLKGRVAVVTGGATGIGLAVGRALVKGGARVVLAGRDSIRGVHALESLGVGNARATFMQTDVRRAADVERLFQHTVDGYGRLDFLFNNAGIEGPESSGRTPADSELDELLATNIKGVLLCLQYGLPRLAASGGGVVVNTGSFVGTTVPMPRATAYGATKSAVLSITSAAAAGYAEQHVRVFAVCPWITDTPMVDRLTGHDEQAKAQFGQMNPSGRIATPDDVAGVVLAMFTGTSGLESGQAVLVDSGGAAQLVEPMRPGRSLDLPYGSMGVRAQTHTTA
jgi:NAD(P)-dependent dehydrogenase (short-subunit alcohol dehydrogenase family)